MIPHQYLLLNNFSNIFPNIQNSAAQKKSKFKVTDFCPCLYFFNFSSDP